MKRYCYFFALLCFSVAAFAQTKPGLSPLTRKYVRDIENAASDEHSFRFKTTPDVCCMPVH
jgi:hypothetical protein